MPGHNFQGGLPPLTDEQRKLKENLRDYVHHLSGKIGERNLFRYKQLVVAAVYIGTTLESFGYKVRRHLYEVPDQTCDNLKAEVQGKAKPTDIHLVGAH